MDDVFAYCNESTFYYIVLTDWFSGKVKPAYPGVYQTQEADGYKFYNYFDGTDWHWGSGDLNKARKDDPMLKKKQKELVVKWRGLSINTEKLK